MSRPRSSDPSIPVSISVPRSLHTRLNELLAYKQSRSRWVCNAIQAKLDAHSKESQVIVDISDKRLLVLCFNRGLIDYEMLMLLKSKLPVEETATEQ
ncbi:MAG: hypothetical protein QF588_07215 [Candidatus Poseidoniaceae archaeon]|jgi:hypothetical protein|nr:hypothetical protein [Candidatus Poseidoniaceae archaeon]